jgi:hypothetical protein
VVSSPAHSYGASASTHASLQVPDPAIRNCAVTRATPLPAPSAAVMPTAAAVPRSAPRAGIEPVGAVLSTTRVSAAYAALPAASVARARSS